MRIWREHLRPRLGLLMLASLAMLLTAATTGTIPFIIQKTADDVFVAKNQQMIYWVTAAIVVVSNTFFFLLLTWFGSYCSSPVRRAQRPRTWLSRRSRVCRPASGP